MNRLYFHLFVFIVFIFTAIVHAQTKDPSIEHIAACLDGMAQKEHLSGVVLIARNGKVLFEKPYGYANRADSIPNHLNTRFNMASMNKMFTGMAILQLAETGRLSLEEKVGLYLPDYTNKAVADSVTLHQLLTHTSGLGNFWEELDKVPKQKYKAVDDYIKLFVNKPLLFKPGSQYMYSNSGYTLLGKIVEKVSGMDYFAYISQHVLKPAGMYSTDAIELDQSLPMVASGYTMSTEYPAHWNNNLFQNVFKGGPAGGYYTTASDLLRFANAVTSYKLLNKKYTTLYTTGKVKYDKGSYAYGISVDTINGHGVFGHTGGHFGIANELMMCPELGYTVVIMTNGEVENYWQVSNLIKSGLFGSSASTDNYYFTWKVIETTLRGGEAAGFKAIARNAGKYRLRESVIDRWAYHMLFDKRNKEALSLFRLNVQSFPLSASAVYSLAEGYRLAGDSKQALLVYQKYLQLEPEDAEVREKIKSLEGS